MAGTIKNNIYIFPRSQRQRIKLQDGIVYGSEVLMCYYYVCRVLSTKSEIFSDIDYLEICFERYVCTFAKWLCYSL